MNNQFNSVEAKIRQITKVFDKSYYDRKTKKGILRQRSDLYADCFYVDLAKLRELFVADEEAWRKDLEKAKQKASSINDRAEGLLKEKQEQINILMEEMQNILESCSDSNSDEPSTVDPLNNARSTICATGVVALSETQQLIQDLTPVPPSLKSTNPRTGVSSLVCV